MLVIPPDVDVTAIAALSVPSAFTIWIVSLAAVVLLALIFKKVSVASFVKIIDLSSSHLAVIPPATDTKPIDALSVPVVLVSVIFSFAVVVLSSTIVNERSLLAFLIV